MKSAGSGALRRAITRATGTSPADLASKASSSRLASKWDLPPKSTPTRMARGRSPATEVAVGAAAVKVGTASAGAAWLSGLLRRFGGVEIHRTTRHHRGDGVLVN